MGLKSIWRSLTMGNQQTSLSTASSVVARDEPLECVIKEAKRDEHLKNLGMKRNKSIRKSIVKKLRKREKKDEMDGENKENKETAREVPKPAPVHIETRTSIGSKIEGGTRVEVLAVEERREKELVGDTQPLPAHIHNEVPRKMDKLRRSFRHSMRKRKETTNELSRSQKWELDESAVRAGTCQFYVKYLGSVEVFESRGMQVCEAAVNRLKEERRRTVRGTLAVSGDSIKLTDDDTKALLLDQTIEKVSFCAPDRNFERGFSYISRDGTSRRWMCHAFMANGDSGERLSHAVGCAFGICLEYKQKRDKTNVSVQYDSNESSFTRSGSFRVGTLTERLADPQSMRVNVTTPRNVEVEETKSVSRPRPTELMYQRQASYRGLGQISGHTPFKRQAQGQLSLRLNDLPSTRERLGGLGGMGGRDRMGGLLTEEPILEDIELPPSNLEGNSSKSLDLLSEDPFSPSEMASGSSTPAPRGGDASSTYSMSPPPTLLIPIKLHKLPETPESEHNPWDNVPDQPTSPVPRLPSSQPPKTGLDALDILSSFKQPSSMPISSYPPVHRPPFSSLPLNDIIQTDSPHRWTIEQTADTFKVAPFIKTSSSLELGKDGSSSGYNSPTSTNSGTEDLWQTNLLETEPSVLEQSMQNSILEDPFDAEWAAIATRNYKDKSNTNPFTPDNSVKSFENSVKSFELQL